MDALIRSFGLAGALFIILVMILWAFLPLAVFGIKKRLDTIIAVSKDIRKELKTLNSNNNTEKSEPTNTELKPTVNGVEYRAIENSSTESHQLNN
jgi:hypothetical protein